MKTLSKMLDILMVMLLFSGMLAGCGKGTAAGSAEESHESDIEVLERILEEQAAQGGTIPSDWNDSEHYTWDENGRLTEINWRFEKTLKGNLSLEGLTELNHLNCEGNELTGLDISKNTKLTMICCSSNELTSLDVSGCTALGTGSLIYDEEEVTITGISQQ